MSTCSATPVHFKEVYKVIMNYFKSLQTGDHLTNTLCTEFPSLQFQVNVQLQNKSAKHTDLNQIKIAMAVFQV